MTARLERRSSSLPAQDRRVLADKVVLRLREAEAALVRAGAIDQVKLVLDVSAAQEVFARRQQLGEAVIGYAFAIKMRALGRLGDLLKPMDKAKGTRGTARGRIASGGIALAPPEDVVPTLEKLGVSKKVASVAQQLAALPAAQREAIAQGEKTLAAVRRERKAIEVRRAVSLPDAKYRVLYADPPWAYRDKADAGAVQAGGVEPHYPTMTIAELCALAIPAIVLEDAVLFLWVTSPLLFESAAVIGAWGFTYKASFVWDKIGHNMGHYNSVRHEFLLVCTRGSCTPDHLELFDSVQRIEKTTHSSKPEDFRRIIETLYPYGKRLELFRRGAPVEGWDAFGFEAQGGAA